MTPPVATLDFETLAIEPRPSYPPLPVGVAIKPWGRRATYYAWGHPAGNSPGAYQAGNKAIAQVLRNPRGALMHHAKFDLDVAQQLPKATVHDTLLLLFLEDPYSNLSLKPAAERLLNKPPSEQEAIRDWLLAHQPLRHAGIRLTNTERSEHYWGGYIAYAPGQLVKRYANGDVERTEQLFRLLHKRITQRGMLTAYERERRLLGCLRQSEAHGLRVNLKQLTQDVEYFTQVYELVSAQLMIQLRTKDAAVLDSGQQLVSALVSAKLVDVARLGLTPKGRAKSDKAALQAAITNPLLKQRLIYRASLGTCLRTFMQPWLATAKRSGGLIYTTWHQTRGDGDTGARTGRLTSTPNFQNIPKALADQPPPGCPLLPSLRSYVVPHEDDHVLLDRDYSQQELRVLAHMEGGELLRAYQQDPWLDVHEHARQLINKLTGRNFDRKPIKNTGFGLLYGMGVGLLAEKSNLSVELAQEVKSAYLKIFPGLRLLYQEMHQRMLRHEPIRTWGGREYYCEPSREVAGKGMMTFDYKLVNYLIQGSSADCTKEALCRLHEEPFPGVKLLLNVHDQILISAPRKHAREAMQWLKQKMESVEFAVPMLSEGKWGRTWADLKPYDEKGRVVCREV